MKFITLVISVFCFATLQTQASDPVTEIALSETVQGKPTTYDKYGNYVSTPDPEEKVTKTVNKLTLQLKSLTDAQGNLVVKNPEYIKWHICTLSANFWVETNGVRESKPGFDTEVTVTYNSKGRDIRRDCSPLPDTMINTF